MTNKICKTKDVNKVNVLPKNTTALIQPLDQDKNNENAIKKMLHSGHCEQY